MIGMDRKTHLLLRIGPSRVYSKNEDGPGLAVSRSLGDLFGHTVGVSADPEISYKELDHEDKFIVIGSDGIWDVMNSAEVVGFIFEKTSTDNNVPRDKIAEITVNECRNRWEVINLYKQKLQTEKNQNKDIEKSKISQPFYSIDDISAVICFLNISD